MIRFAPGADADVPIAPDVPCRRLTMAARACLAKLEYLDGTMRESRAMRIGYEVREFMGIGSHPGSTIFWFPKAAGDELIERRFVDAAGKITKAGMAALERQRI